MKFLKNYWCVTFALLVIAFVVIAEAQESRNERKHLLTESEKTALEKLFADRAAIDKRIERVGEEIKARARLGPDEQMRLDPITWTVTISKIDTAAITSR